MKKVAFLTAISLFVFLLAAPVWAFTADAQHVKSVTGYDSWLYRFRTVLENTTFDESEINRLDAIALNRPGTENYLKWFNDLFMPEFSSAEPLLSSSQKARLDYILKVKPVSLNTGTNFDSFLRVYLDYLDRYAPLLSNSQRECLSYLRSAAPALEEAGMHYPLFVTRFGHFIERYEPMLSTGQKEILDHIVDVKPGGGHAYGYNSWLDLFTRYYNKYSPFITSSQQEVLDYIERIKPAEEDDNQFYYTISKEKLLEIRFYVRRGLNENALRELDMILGL